MAREPDELSALEQKILLALVRLHPNGYGVSIQDEIAARTGKTISFGSIYACLDRLGDRRLVEPRTGAPIAERGGRRRIHYTVSVSGRCALNLSLASIDEMRSGLGMGAPA